MPLLTDHAALEKYNIAKANTDESSEAFKSLQAAANTADATTYILRHYAACLQNGYGCSKNLAKAKEILLQVLRKEPKYIAAAHDLALLFHTEGDIYNTINYYTIAARYDQTLCYSGGTIPIAKQAFQQVEKLATGDSARTFAKYHFALCLSEGYGCDKDQDKAEKIFEALIKDSTAPKGTGKVFGVILKQRNQIDKAAESFFISASTPDQTACFFQDTTPICQQAFKELENLAQDTTHKNNLTVQYYYALCLLNGYGCTKNQVTAEKFLLDLNSSNPNNIDIVIALATLYKQQNKCTLRNMFEKIMAATDSIKREFVATDVTDNSNHRQLTQTDLNKLLRELFQSAKPVTKERIACGYINRALDATSSSLLTQFAKLKNFYNQIFAKQAKENTAISTAYFLAINQVIEELLKKPRLEINDSTAITMLCAESLSKNAPQADNMVCRVANQYKARKMANRAFDVLSMGIMSGDIAIYSYRFQQIPLTPTINLDNYIQSLASFISINRFNLTSQLIENLSADLNKIQELKATPPLDLQAREQESTEYVSGLERLQAQIKELQPQVEISVRSSVTAAKKLLQLDSRYLTSVSQVLQQSLLPQLVFFKDYDGPLTREMFDQLAQCHCELLHKRALATNSETDAQTASEHGYLPSSLFLLKTQREQFIQQTEKFSSLTDRLINQAQRAAIKYKKEAIAPYMENWAQEINDIVVNFSSDIQRALSNACALVTNLVKQILIFCEVDRTKQLQSPQCNSLIKILTQCKELGYADAELALIYLTPSQATTILTSTTIPAKDLADYAKVLGTVSLNIFACWWKLAKIDCSNKNGLTDALADRISSEVEFADAWKILEQEQRQQLKTLYPDTLGETFVVELENAVMAQVAISSQSTRIDASFGQPVASMTCRMT